MTVPLQRRAQAPWLIALVAIAALFVAHASRRWGAITPDVAVTVAYAQNLADGHGLVLNVGAERVERAPSLLWTVAIAPASALGLSPLSFARTLGAALATMAIVLVAFVPSQMRGRAPRWLDLLAPLVCGSMANYAIAAASGAEHGLLAALTAAALLALAREERDAEAYPWSALWLVLAFVARPDAALFAFAIGAAKLLRNLAPKRPRRQDVLWVITLATGLFGFTLFRLAYFAAVLPAAYGVEHYSVRSAVFVGRAEALEHSSRWLAEHKLSTLAWLAVAALFGPSPHAARIAIVASAALAMLSTPAFGRAAPDHRALATAALLLSLVIGEGARSAAIAASWLAPRASRPLVRAAVSTIAAFSIAWSASRSIATGATTITQSPPTLSPTVTRALAIDGRPTLFACGDEPRPYDGRFVESELHEASLSALGDVGHELPELIHARDSCAAARPIMDALYLRIGSSNAFVHRGLVASPYAVCARRIRAAIDGAPDGVTLSHARIAPGATLLVELSLSRLSATRTSVTVIDDRAAVVASAEIIAFGGLIDGERLLPGERPRVRVAVRAPREGRYALRWTREDGASVALGSLIVARASSDDERAEQDIARMIAEDRFDQGWTYARALSLRIAADPLDQRARDSLSRFTRAMAERARAAADGGALSVAASIAQSARALAPFDRATQSLCGEVAERLADAAVDAERGRDWPRAFELASSAVRIDPRRSWSRRRAEALRARRVPTAAPGPQIIYRDAAEALASGDAADLDRVIVRMADAGYQVEAARLAERAAHTPRDPHARVAVARGLVSQARAREAVALVSGVPCREARDVEVTRALRAIMGASAYRPFDEACSQPR